MKSPVHWHNRDWLAVGDHGCLRFIKTKLQGFEHLNLSTQKMLMTPKSFKDFTSRVKDYNASFQGKRKNRIYFSAEALTKNARDKIGKRLGATGLILLNGRTPKCEKYFSGEPFACIIEVDYDFAHRKLTLVKLKGDNNDDDLHSVG
jgi:hypothetical protein